MSIEGYESPADYTYLAGYNSIGAIDVGFTFNRDIDASQMIITFQD